MDGYAIAKYEIEGEYIESTVQKTQKLHLTKFKNG